MSVILKTWYFPDFAINDTLGEELQEPFNTRNCKKWILAAS